MKWGYLLLAIVIIFAISVVSKSDNQITSATSLNSILNKGVISIKDSININQKDVNEKNNFFVKQLLSVFITIIILSLIILIVFKDNIFKKKTNNMNNNFEDSYDNIIIAAREAKKQGFNNDEIREGLISKGWSIEQTDYIIKRI